MPGAPGHGHDLGTLLYDHRVLLLAVLNACEGARSSARDPFAGVAQSLLKQRIPAVLAMQFAITDSAANILAREFYTTLASGAPVDMALAHARRAIFATYQSVEWGTPVLFMRAPDGKLFDLAEAAPAPTEVASQPQWSVKSAPNEFAGWVRRTFAPFRFLICHPLHPTCN